MVTRSIVGRVLILAVLIVSLGVIAQAALIITHGPAKKTGIAQRRQVTAADQQDTAPIRVVYPGPLGDNPAPARKIADAAPASPLPVAPPPAAMPSLSSSSVGAIAQASASQEDFDTGEQTAVTPSPSRLRRPAASDARSYRRLPPLGRSKSPRSTPWTPDSPVPSQQTAETSAKGVNINSASAEALNHLQGGGRIGQTIVQHRPYKSVDDLVKKKVLRRAVYDQIKNQIAAQ